jgi:hypothetical protein
MIDWLVQHLINEIPVYVWAVVAGAGLGGYLVSGLLGAITAIKPYAKLIHIVSIVVFAFGVFMTGGAGVTAAWQERIKLKQQEVEAAQKKAQAANVKIKYVVVQKLKVIHDKQVVVKHDIQRDAAVIDSECKLAPQAIKDLNEATE